MIEHENDGPPIRSSTIEKSRHPWKNGDVLEEVLPTDEADGYQIYYWSKSPEMIEYGEFKYVPVMRKPLPRVDRRLGHG